MAPRWMMLLGRITIRTLRLPPNSTLYKNVYANGRRSSRNRILRNRIVVDRSPGEFGGAVFRTVAYCVYSGAWPHIVRLHPFLPSGYWEVPRWAVVNTVKNIGPRRNPFAPAQSACPPSNQPIIIPASTTTNNIIMYLPTDSVYCIGKPTRPIDSKFWFGLYHKAAPAQSTPRNQTMSP